MTSNASNTAETPVVNEDAVLFTDDEPQFTQVDLFTTALIQGSCATPDSTD